MRSFAQWHVVAIGMCSTSYCNAIYFRCFNMWYCFHIEDNANSLLNCFPTGQLIRIWKKKSFDVSAEPCVLTGLPWCLRWRQNLPSMQETWVQSLSQDLLEKGMTTHPNILVCRIPQTEEADRLQSMGHKKVRIIQI